jgi:hypothetical protein
MKAGEASVHAACRRRDRPDLASRRSGWPGRIGEGLGPGAGVTPLGHRDTPVSPLARIIPPSL